MASLGPYRHVGTSGAYPEWLRELKTTTGVYAIKNVHSGEVVYVGSSNGKLYATVTRHLQSWRRAKKFWSGMRGTTDHDPGVTYERSLVTVAIGITTKADHLHEESRLIHSLKPRDNLVANPDGLDTVPF